MPTPGYPDYTRLNRSGGVELFSATGNVANLTTLYQGYVGNFSFTALTTLMQASTDFVSVDLLWYSDNTFSQVVAFRRCIRTGSQFAQMSYVNLSEWMKLQIETVSGNAMPFQFLSIYGTQDGGSAFQLASNDVPLIGQILAVNATTTSSIFPAHVQPGPGQFGLQTTAASWFVNVLYYDWGTKAYVTYKQFNSADYVRNVGEPLACLDTPQRFDYHNGDAAAKSFVTGWTST